MCEQILLGGLPLAYFNNVTSVFPRSPLMACLMFGGPKLYPAGRQSYYGKTFGMHGPNDALYLWDRWLGADRTRPSDALPDEQSVVMRQFFSACEAEFGRPLLNKVNGPIASAHLVGEVLDNSYFICVQRDDLYLAQSLYQARLDISGDVARPYGLYHESFENATDPAESVCRQAKFYRKFSTTQQARLGADRFWIVSYEELCENPQQLVDRVAQDVLHIDQSQVREVAPSKVRDQQRLDDGLFNQLRSWIENTKDVVDSG